MNPMLVGFIIGAAAAYGLSLALVGAWIGTTELVGWITALRAQRAARTGRART